MNLLELKKFFQQLKLATIQKKLYFSFKNHQDLEEILKILQKKHLIVGYTKNPGQKSHADAMVKIFLRYDLKGVCVIQEIKTVSSLRQRRMINVKQIKAFLNDYPYAVALIRTRRGILSVNDCWNHRIGGEFLVYLK